MVTCAKCGVENPDEANTCRMCGNTLGTGMRHCVSCGRSIDWNVNVCPYCGHDFRIVMQDAAKKTMSTGTKVLLYIVSILIPIAGIIIGIVFLLRDDPEEKRVGKICIILGIVMTLLTIGFAVLLYGMVIGFGTVGYNTPTTTLTMTPVIDGYMFSFGAVNEHVSWSDVRVIVTDAQNPVSWSPDSEDLSGDVAVTYDYGARTLSPIDVTLSVTDLTGDGSIGMNDRMTLTSSLGFNAATDYEIKVIWEPSDGVICSLTFSG